MAQVVSKLSPWAACFAVKAIPFPYPEILTNVRPNFSQVHLGPGVQGTRKTNPAVDIGQLPPVDCVLLSHYHADHFDQVVEESSEPRVFDC